MEQKRIVAFIDILGFKTLVKQWLNDKTIGARIEETLIKSIEWIGGREALKVSNDDWKIRFFSDCVAISVPANNLGILNIIKGLSAFQRQMFEAGFLIRGAISFGEHYETELTTISPPLIEAYQLESQKAIHSRILISEKLLLRIKKIKDPEIRKEIKEYLLLDNDKDCFICYLIFDEDDPWFTGEEFYLSHKKKIESTLVQRDIPSEILHKYFWLADFHNWCLRTTAERLKKSGILSEENVWDFGRLMIINDDVKGLSFENLLWNDKAYTSEDYWESYSPKNTDWIKQWPNAISDDDEEEPDREDEGNSI